MLWLGTGAAASHRAASIVWGLDGLESAPVELTTSGRRRASDPGLVVHRARAWRPGDITIRGAFRVTSVPKTVLDLCGVVRPSVVELAIESALRRRLTTRGQLEDALERSAVTVIGRGILRELLGDLPSSATESTLETIVWRLLVDEGLRPVRQYEVRTEDGRFVARVDFAYPAVRVAVEADGRRFHSAKADWSRDLFRSNALTSLGWVVYRVTWDDATKRPRRVAADVRALLARRARPEP
ncbi:MAG: DUF559 domain-containing protein [Actinomycetota bacterium]